MKMKKTIALLVVCGMFIMLYGCGDTKVIGGIEYDTYGLFNKEEKRNSDFLGFLCMSL